MNLSKRLNSIAEMIPSGSRVIDVGCDHALLSIYLEKEKNCTCIAADINNKALESARINKKKYNSNIEIILTDGINDIEINRDDYIVIAGMGTTTISHILDKKVLSDNLVLSSNNQIYELRKMVTSLGYKICDEKFICDHQKKYVIINFIKGNKKYSNIDMKYGPILKNNSEYLIYELEKLFDIKEKIRNSNFHVRYKNQKEINKLKKMIDKIQGE